MTQQELPLQQNPEDRPLFASAAPPKITKQHLLLETFRDFFFWWYVQMPIYYILTVQRLHIIINDKLSISLLLRHFFTPWQRRYNLLARIIGVVVKSIYLPFAIIIYLVAMGTGVLITIGWIALPILTIVFLTLTPLIQR